MGKVLKDLLDQLSLEKLEENLFRGKSQDLGLGVVFGGQVMGQALSAAKETVLPNSTFTPSIRIFCALVMSISLLFMM